MSYFMLSDSLQPSWQGPFLFLSCICQWSRNYLAMDRSSRNDKFQELLHSAWEEKGQIDLWGERAVLIVLWGL